MKACLNGNFLVSSKIKYTMKRKKGESRLLLNRFLAGHDSRYCNMKLLVSLLQFAVIFILVEQSRAHFLPPPPPASKPTSSLPSHSPRRPPPQCPVCRRIPIPNCTYHADSDRSCGIRLIIDNKDDPSTICDHCHIDDWDVSKIKDMSYAFYNPLDQDFNGDVSKWDTSNVVNMSHMFYLKDYESHKMLINGNVSKWDTSNVVNMNSMFHGTKFAGDVSKWDTSKVVNMNSMFHGTKFAGDVSKWKTLKVNDMDHIFENSLFNRTLCGGAWKNHYTLDCGGDNSNCRGRYGCCLEEEYMWKPELNPFNTADCCRVCQPGYYMDVPNSFLSCKTCPLGKYQNERSRSKCNNNCPAGSAITGNRTACKKCTPGKFQDQKDQTGCKSNCNAGSSINSDKTACTACATGQYQDENDQTGCLSCTAGQYQDQNDQTGCKPCTTGRYQDGKGSSSCKSNCNAGSSINSDKTACAACATGQYQDENNQNRCKECGRGKYSSETGGSALSQCKLCPIGKYSDTNSTSSCLLCPFLFYNKQSGSHSCKPISQLSKLLLGVGCAIVVSIAISYAVHRYRLSKVNEENETQMSEINQSLMQSHAEQLERSRNPLEQQQFIIPSSDLHLKDRIGVGGCGWVYKATMGDSTIVAAKEILSATTNPDDIREFEHEAKILTQMNHPQVLRVLGFCIKPAKENEDNQERRYIVTEFAPNGSLESVIENATKIQQNIQETGTRLVQMPFTKIEALAWALQIASGMAFLHRRGFVHRDIKPQNVLLNESKRALVADLGTVRHPTYNELPEGTEISEEEKEKNIKEFCKEMNIDEEIGCSAKAVQYMTANTGTPLYMAPEQFNTESKCILLYLF